MRIRQSDLSSYARCARQKKHYDLAKRGEGPQPRQLSATAFGTVMHHAVQVLETMHDAGDGGALDTALATFSHYWMPDNIGELTEPIDTWLPRQTYGGLRDRGLHAIRDYYSLLVNDDSQLLALEINFEIPIDLGPVGQHVVTGTIDRVCYRKYKRVPYISVEDFKTGRQPTYLRYSPQWTVYCWATLQREFWEPWPDADERWKASCNLTRRGMWIDLANNKRVDAGWRAEADYARMKIALTEYVRAVEADIYPLSMSGENCLHCSFREVCGGVPVPDEDAGKPA